MERYHNKFPICAALSHATTGRAGGFVRDEQPDFEESILGLISWLFFPLLYPEKAYAVETPNRYA